jgi:hypothetical protein
MSILIKQPDRSCHDMSSQSASVAKGTASSAAGQSGLFVTRDQPFEEQHFPIRYWALRWGYSVKTVREWFWDEYGPGILRQSNIGRRKKRDYTTIMVSPSAAARVYTKHTQKELTN